MIEEIYGQDEIVRILRMEKPYFNEDDFEENMKTKFSTLYRSLKNNHTDYLDDLCTKDYIGKLLKNKEKILMLDDDIDFINAQNITIRKYRQKNDYIEIDFDLFVFYIDYMKNNKSNSHPTKKKYFDKAYSVTLRIPYLNGKKIVESTCPKCGGHLIKDTIRRKYTCEYCKYEKFMDYSDWKICNIQEI